MITDKREVLILIKLSYLGNHHEFNLEEGLNLLIVRKPPKKIPKHFIHVPQLSPSLELFNQAQIWKKEYEKIEDWFPLYEERFIKEIQERDDMVRALRKLEKRIQEGCEIRLFCFCKNEQFCHRRLIGEELIKRGYEVDWCRKPVEPVLEQLSLF